MSQYATALPFHSSIAPWFSVRNSAKAIAFYKSAFGAIEVHHQDLPGGGAVARLSIDGAEFWLIEDSSTPAIEPLGGNSIRMILTVADPDAVFARALSAGATEIFSVGEAHGWRLCRVADPFGLHWEIGHPLTA